MTRYKRLIDKLTPILAVVVALSGAARAETIPLTIGAAAMQDLASDKFYHAFGRTLSEPGSPFAVKVMVRGEGGSDEQNLAAVRRGRMQMGGISYAAISTSAPELAVLNAAFLLTSYDEIDFILAHGLEDRINAMLQANGLVGLRHIPASWNIVYGKRPILSPADAKKVRMRARIDSGSMLFLKALDADVIHVAATEVIPSLQTGLIDGGETNSFVYLLNGIYAEAPHLIMTRHVPSITVVIANRDWWNSMTAAQRQRIDGALPPAPEWRRLMRADEDRLIAAAARKGITVHELAPEKLREWQETAAASHPPLLDEIGGDARAIYDLIVAGKVAYAKRKN
ncbi:MAG: TRAP transporter substrate-binding protein [Alphaproteobacteria bacterium]|nr:TRAP transporter substrate-binding protein [Alphaproteobacteria bacterium]